MVKNDFSFIQSKEFPKNLKIALISDNDIFGDEEILLNIPRKYTSKCMSKQATLLWISKEDFITKINKDSLKFLTTVNSDRDRFRQGKFIRIERKHKEESTESSMNFQKEVHIQKIARNRRIITNSTRSPISRSKINFKLINIIKKKSLLDSVSPTASILENCTMYAKPKKTVSYTNINGFQPSNKNPSGIFTKIHKRFKYIAFDNLIS